MPMTRSDKSSMRPKRQFLPLSTLLLLLLFLSVDLFPEIRCSQTSSVGILVDALKLLNDPKFKGLRVKHFPICSNIFIQDLHDQSL